MALRLRTFTSGDAGYNNATLGTTGIAVAFPTESQGCIISISAGCFIGFKDSSTLLTFSSTNYGSFQGGNPYTFLRMRDGTQTYVHIAPWSSTAIVSVAFI